MNIDILTTQTFQLQPRCTHLELFRPFVVFFICSWISSYGRSELVFFPVAIYKEDLIQPESPACCDEGNKPNQTWNQNRVWFRLVRSRRRSTTSRRLPNAVTTRAVGDAWWSSTTTESQSRSQSSAWVTWRRRRSSIEWIRRRSTSRRWNGYVVAGSSVETGAFVQNNGGQIVDTPIEIERRVGSVDLIIDPSAILTVRLATIVKL
mmetsp:Transcript_32200/g.67119  ORF Transcript_32200/g.67119 Transcript_32200/m.67119 type:complete len:206 (-) Transcript_32200:148-765(-)